MTVVWNDVSYGYHRDRARSISADMCEANRVMI